MSDIAIRVENLGKKYLITHQQERQRYNALREVLSDGFKNLFLTAANRQPLTIKSSEEFWAVNDVSFEIKQGEAVGIIGRNGAGKSTLLKLLSRITEPTRGRIKLNGTVASLLEVGTGFHPELTGRENIFLNGAILGMSRIEIKNNFDDIVAFAEVERFLDTPVKRYSSGMYVRLAFAVAAHLQPDILIVDEVLAVGDSAFQQKCLGKMNSITHSEGRTVLFVSHNMQAISALCSRCIVLEQGRVISSGDVDSAVAVYLGNSTARTSAIWERPQNQPTSALHCLRVECNLGGHGKRMLTIKILAESVQLHKPCFLAIDIRDAMGVSIMQAIPRLDGFLDADQGRHMVEMGIDLPALIPGTYFLGVWFGPHNTETVEEIKSTAAFEITESPTLGRVFPHHYSNGYVVPHSYLIKA